MNRIAILGVGSLGSCYGSFLSAAGYDTIGLTRRSDHSYAINNKGILLRHKSEEKIYRFVAYDDPSILAERDIIFVLVKSYDTLSAAKVIRDYASPNSLVVTLQSGLGNIETLVNICGGDRILAGESYFGAKKLTDTEVDLGDNLRTVVGELTGKNTDRLSNLVKVMKDSGINVETTLDVKNAVWGKMVVITAQHGLGAITGLTFGQMLESSYCIKIITQLLKELELIAEMEKVSLVGDPVVQVLNNWRSLPNHKSSMWQDLEHGRSTEIDAINGALVRLGNKYSVSTPFNEMITNLIHILEGRINSGRRGY